MKYVLIGLSSLLLAGCVASGSDKFAAQQGYAAPAVVIIEPWVANTQVIALNMQLQHAYADTEVQILRLGSEIKITYLSDSIFAAGNAVLLPSANITLAPLLSALKVYPQVNLRIECFSDSKGSEETNLVLTQQRAQNLIDYFMDEGITVHKMSQKGYGNAFPLATNTTLAGRMQNRRVVVSIKFPEVDPNPVPQHAA
jgi:outer membrane protein OmpA-like peptidoglycan-associated protein